MAVRRGKPHAPGASGGEVGMLGRYSRNSTPFLISFCFNIMTKEVVFLFNLDLNKNTDNTIKTEYTDIANVLVTLVKHNVLLLLFNSFLHFTFTPLVSSNCWCSLRPMSWGMGGCDGLGPGLLVFWVHRNDIPCSQQVLLREKLSHGRGLWQFTDGLYCHQSPGIINPSLSPL